MGILVPDGSGTWVDGRAYAVADKLRHGDPTVGWPGDPDMELHWRPAPWERWEVMRRCEDGLMRPLAWWAPEEIEIIPATLAQMRLDSPAHVPVLERIDKANDRRDKEVGDRIADALGAAMEHALKLEHDRNEPRTTFRQVGGRRDS